MWGRKTNGGQREGASSEVLVFRRARHSMLLLARDAAIFEFGESRYALQVRG
ncbi:unnamed protein product [Larinioides sclopetarius]|uniref:Uncharacterized protein n=1 Tax=Larinioides sclopetarius TaxID=280406 RepID=A0AAV2AA78_9ARAC